MRQLLVMALGVGLMGYSPPARTSQVSTGSPEPAALGRIDFPTGAAPAAQREFLTGVLLLHSFEYELAASAFQRAQELEPRFAMAHWGEAMTHNHPLWGRQERERAWAILLRLGATPAEQLQATGTEKERDWLRALHVLFGDGDKTERDREYSDHLRRMHDRYPDDHEVAAFYALSILGTVQEREFAVYMRAAAVGEEIFHANPAHPGAAHYLIHAYDDPVHAPLGVRAAAAYERIAPAAAHAQHMISHIFVALGDWDRVVKANLIARDVRAERDRALGRAPNDCGHTPHWLLYGRLQQGRPDDAEEVLRRCVEQYRADPAPTGAGTVARMLAAYLIDSGRPARIERWQVDLSGLADADVEASYGIAYAGLVAHGATDPARDFLLISQGSDDPVVSVQRLQIEGLIALAEGQTTRGIASIRQAADLESSLPFFGGPPAVAKPAAELLGELLLREGDAAGARIAFESALRRAPERPAALLGLLAASRADADPVAAADAERRLRRAWAEAEPAFDADGRVRRADIESSGQ